MPKDPYVKPKVTSEVLEPGALASLGTGTVNGGGDDGPDGDCDLTTLGFCF